MKHGNHIVSESTHFETEAFFAQNPNKIRAKPFFQAGLSVPTESLIYLFGGLGKNPQAPYGVETGGLSERPFTPGTDPEGFPEADAHRPGNISCLGENGLVTLLGC